jgi:hypothetical protein
MEGGMRLSTLRAMLACIMLAAVALPGPSTEAAEPKIALSAPVRGPVQPEPVRVAPLDLSLRDLDRYLYADEFWMPLSDELEEIIIRGRKPEPLPEQRVLPMGLGAIFYAVGNPTQAWRIFAPDPNVAIPDRSEDDARDPPGAYRGQILAPGRIFE